MANITITTAANLIRETWPTLTLETLHKNLVASNLVDRRYEAFVTGRERVGDNVNVPGFAEISASKLTNMTGALTFSANTESTTQIAINTLAYAAVKVDFGAMTQSYMPLQEMYTGEIARAVAQQIDTDIYTDLDTATQTVGTDNVDLTEDNVLRAWQYLSDANAEVDERYGVVSPASLISLKKIDSFRSSLYSQAVGSFDAGKGRGFVGRVHGVDWYESTNLPAGAAGKKNFMFWRQAEALVFLKAVTVDVKEPHDELASAVRAWSVYGVKKMRDAVLVEMDGK